MGFYGATIFNNINVNIETPTSIDQSLSQHTIMYNFTVGEKTFCIANIIPTQLLRIENDVIKVDKLVTIDKNGIPKYEYDPTLDRVVAIINGTEMELPASALEE